MKLKNISLKKGLALLGYTDIEISRGYNYRSGFANNTAGQLEYFSTRDLRGNTPEDSYFILNRTAAHRKDYTGGGNRYEIVPRLKEMGYLLQINKIASDFNKQ